VRAARCVSSAGLQRIRSHKMTSIANTVRTHRSSFRNTGHRVGRAIRTAGRRYIEMMARCDPNNVGYYVW
jgi:hypothetical protein